MDYQVDARGLACPRPVMEVQKVLSGLDKGTVTVRVDNATARDNVSRLARSRGWNVSVEQREGDYYLTITKASSS